MPTEKNVTVRKGKGVLAGHKKFLQIHNLKKLSLVSYNIMFKTNIFTYI
jgi:hypothetical protein